MTPGFVVAVMKNFQGFTELMNSVDIPVYLQIMNNWDNNRGCSVPWNEGMQKCYDAGCDEIFVFNDDVVLEPGTLQKLVESAQEGHWVTSFLNTRDGQVHGEKAYVPHPDFSGVCISRECIDVVEYFDPRIHSYFNDNDYTYRVGLAGGWAGTRIDAGGFHKGSVTQFWNGTEDRVVSHAEFDRTREYYIEKWNGPPGQETFTVPFDGKPHL